MKKKINLKWLIFDTCLGLLIACVCFGFIFETGRLKKTRVDFIVSQQLPNLEGQKLEEFKNKLVQSADFKKIEPFLAPEFAEKRKLIFDAVSSFVSKFPVDLIFKKGFDGQLKFSCKENVAWSDLFEEYCCRALCEGGSGRFHNTWVEDDFKKYVKKDGVVQVFRAVAPEKVVSLVDGEALFDCGILSSIHAGPARYAGTGFYVNQNKELATEANFCDYEILYENKPATVVEFAFDSKNVKCVDFSELKNLVKAATFEYFLPNMAETALVLEDRRKEGFEVSHGLDLIDQFESQLMELKEYCGFDYFAQNLKVRANALKNEFKKIQPVVSPDYKFTADDEIYLNYMCDISNILTSCALSNYGLIAKMLGYDAVKSEAADGDLHYCFVNPKELHIFSKYYLD